MVEQRVDRLAVAVHDVEDAVGQPGLAHSSAIRIDSDGTRSDGFNTNVLPHASATGTSTGDHGREIERRDARAHANRLPQRPGVDVGADVLAEFALELVRDARRELDDLHARTMDPVASASVFRAPR